jgi:hypothetical protein
MTHATYITYLSLHEMKSGKRVIVNKQNCFKYDSLFIAGTKSIITDIYYSIRDMFLVDTTLQVYDTTNTVIRQQSLRKSNPCAINMHLHVIFFK